MDRIFACGATPLMPSVPAGPCPCPAISEAIQVPCMPQLPSLDEVPTPLRSGPVVTDPDRSGTSGWTPLSRTATRTRAAPLADRGPDAGPLGDRPRRRRVDRVQHPLLGAAHAVRKGRLAGRENRS